MSPQTRHGRPVPAGQRKTNPGTPASAKAPTPAKAKAPTPAKAPAADTTPAPAKAEVPAKAAAPAKGQAAAKSPDPTRSKAPVVPIDPDADLRDGDSTPAEAPKPATSRARTRSAAPASADRAHRRRTEQSRNPVVRGLRGYFGAYLPLLLVFCVIFAGIWAWTSFGPHTVTAAESWTKIASHWKGERDTARAQVLAAAQKNDFAGEIKAYKEVSRTTGGWMDELEKATNHWTAASNADADNQTAASTILQLITSGRTLDLTIDAVTAANTPDALAQHSDDLQNGDSDFNTIYAGLDALITGNTAQPSAVPTLLLPSQAPSPTATPTPSSTPTPTASATVSATPASASPTPTATAS